MKARLSGINEDEVLSYLGCKNGSAAEELSGKISAAYELLYRTAVPKLIYRIFEKDDTQTAALLQGEDIKALLAESHHVVLFGATLGAGVDAAIARLQVSDLSQALIFDACAISAIENVCDNFCADIEAKYGPVTERFSPGYGDLPLGIQSGLFRLLDLQRKAGITLTDSSLMVPQKSVTAIFGIADRPQPKRGRRCVDCNLYETCNLRREGKACAE